MSAPAIAAGFVYTETTVFSVPDKFAADSPYQIAIIDTQDTEGSSITEGDRINENGRKTVRIVAETPDLRVRIGDRVEPVEFTEGVWYFRRSGLAGHSSHSSAERRP